jgi:hypothetical protein
MSVESGSTLDSGKRRIKSNERKKISKDECKLMSLVAVKELGRCNSENLDVPVLHIVTEV